MEFGKQEKNMSNQKNKSNWLYAVKSPCLECDWHLAGESKHRTKCKECSKRIEYNDYIDSIMGSTTQPTTDLFEKDWLIIPTNKYRQSGGVDSVDNTEISFEGINNNGDADCKTTPTGTIDWAAVKKKYVELVVPKKMGIGELAKHFGINIESIRRQRYKDDWPKILEIITFCNCGEIAVAKGKCKRCYQRDYMREHKRVRRKK